MFASEITATTLAEEVEAPRALLFLSLLLAHLNREGYSVSTQYQ
jgi:hypothetical protein